MMMPVILVYGIVTMVTILGGYLLMGRYSVVGIGYAWVIGNGIVAIGIVLKYYWRKVYFL